MSWALGYDGHWARDIGYGVPAWCDHPDCHREINRGLAHVCGSEPWGGEHGCGLYFCDEHLWPGDHETHHGWLCERCDADQPPFQPTPDHSAWVQHKLHDSSWAAWRSEHPDETTAMWKLLRARR